MKSNQERSNECLPPKKREILASNLVSEEKPVVVVPANESQRGEHLGWLANVAAGQGGGVHTSIPADSDSPSYKPLPMTAEHFPSSSSSSSSLSRLPASGTVVTPLPAVYSSPFSQQDGTIQYAQLPPSLQLVGPAYTGPYTGYISSQVVSPVATLASTTSAQHAHLEGYAATVISQTSRTEQPQQLSGSLGVLGSGAASPLPHSVHPTSQYIQVATSPLNVTARAVSAPTTHVPLHLQHSPAVIPHALTLAPSQVVVQYTEGPTTKKEEGQAELLNGETEKGRHCDLLPEANQAKQSFAVKGAASQQHHYETQQVLLPADYAKDTAGLRASLMLLPNSRSSRSDAETGPNKLASSIRHSEKSGHILGKPISRASPFSFTSPEGPKVPVAALSPRTVIQTTQSATEQVPVGLPATSFYPTTQPPIIGYIAGGGPPTPQPLSYHPGLPQQLLIPASQHLLIPVSSSGAAELEPTPSAASTHQPLAAAAVPQAYVTATLPRCDPFGSSEHPPPAPYHHTGAMVQTELHLPVISSATAASVFTSPLPPPASPLSATCPSLPPYFMKGSIIQLADGKLKRVEDLKTEDFIQSAEISSELKIDSSTVERIEGSQTPNSAIIQFAVGEHKAQVSVEVLVEYPFFVFGQGWSSCSPDRTTQLLELSCAKLSVGDVCISLTLKNSKNGSLKSCQTLEAAGNGSNGPLLKSPKTDRQCRSGGSHPGGRENGKDQWVGRAGGPSEATSTQANGEFTCKEKNILLPESPSAEPGGNHKVAGRKRRWSAPEGRKVERIAKEPTLTLPKPSFVSQEVKNCIEGRSIIGK
ncbi:ataxin-1-like [Scleropages formosus]|uniref:Ataxin-1-like n=1 Tax=Scleropages formosus TaxID=113540 RepID=A0A0P7X5I4_SCLFO|nr:ataxin-1-like [Scleropages formosus]